jgi:DNA replication protein DnaC
VEEIHFHADRSIDRNQVMRLADCTFIDRNENLLITGSTEIGKKNVMRFFVLSLTTDYKTEYYDFVIFILCVYL